MTQGPPTNPNPAVIDSTQNFWLNERAASEFSRIVSEVSDVYFTHMRQLAQSGSLSIAGQQAIQMQYQGGGVQAAASTVGAGIGYMAGGPGGAVIGSAIGGGIGSLYTGWAAWQAGLLQQQGVAQQYASELASYSGMNPHAIYNSFFAGTDPSNPAIGAQRLQGYAAARAANPFTSMSSYNAYLDMTRSSFMRDGDPSLAAGFTGAAGSIASMYSGSVGSDARSWMIGAGFIRTGMTSFETGEAFLKRKRAEFNPKAGMDYDMSGRGGATAAVDSRTDADILLNYDKEKQTITGPEQYDKDRFLAAAMRGDRAVMEQMMKLPGSEGAVKGIVDAWKSFNTSGLMAQMGATSADYLSTTATALRFNAGMRRDEARRTGVGEESAVSNQYRFAAHDLGMATNYAWDRANQLWRQAQITNQPEDLIAAEEARKQAMNLDAGAGQMRREAGQRDFAVDSSRIGIYRSDTAIAGTRAALFGGAQDMQAALEKAARVNVQDQGAIRKLLSQTEDLEEQNRLRAKLNDSIREEIENRTKAARIVGEVNSQMAALGANMATSRMSAAYTGGAGGLAGQGFAVEALSTQQGAEQGALANAQSIARNIRDNGGDPEKNPEYQQAMARYYQETARTAEIRNMVGTGPLTLGLSRRERQLGYESQVLGMIPGAYGGMRQAQRGLMDTFNQEAGERQAMRADAIRRGIWSESQQSIYEQQMQEIGLKQASTFQQLSVGWESRMVSEMINAPHDMSYISGQLSYRSAVGAGVSNPHFGINSADMPHFLRQAMYASSLGGTGTPGGYNATALAGGYERGRFGLPGNLGGGGGGNPLDGATLNVNINMGGQTFSGTGTFSTTKGNSADTNPSALSEAFGISHAGSNHQ
jgi:hypothetical protein